MRYKIRKITKPLDEYQEYIPSKGIPTYKHNYLTSVKVVNSKYIYDIIFECCCGTHVILSHSAYYSRVRSGGIEKCNCGCIDKAYEDLIKSSYHNRNLTKTENTPALCKSCDGYYSALEDNRSCGNCNEVLRLKVLLYATFEDIMRDWDPTTHNARYKKLPYLSGTSLKGYKVKGFTYVDSRIYPQVSKLMWFKTKRYIACTLSKENLKRLGKEGKYRKGKPSYLRLHRYVLGLGDGLTSVGDHVKGFTLDNRHCNLRVADVHSNAYNSRKQEGKCKSSKYKGVYPRPRYVSKPWRMNLKRGDSKYIEYFTSEEEAARGYDRVLRENHPSEFNLYNFPLKGERRALK